MSLQVVGHLALEMSAVLSPLIQEVVQPLQFDKQMFGGADLGSRARQSALRVFQICRCVGCAAAAAVVSRLIFGPAFRIGASNESICKKCSGDRVVELFHVFRFDQSGLSDGRPDFMAEGSVFFAVRAAIVVELDLESCEVPDMRASHVGDDCFFRTAFFAGSDHDRRAMRVIGTDKNALVASQLLEPYPNVCLDVLDQMSQVNMAVCIGQRGGDKNLTLHSDSIRVSPRPPRRAVGVNPPSKQRFLQTHLVLGGLANAA